MIILNARIGDTKVALENTRFERIEANELAKINHFAIMIQSGEEYAFSHLFGSMIETGSATQALYNVLHKWAAEFGRFPNHYELVRGYYAFLMSQGYTRPEMEAITRRSQRQLYNMTHPIGLTMNNKQHAFSLFERLVREGEPKLSQPYKG